MSSAHRPTWDPAQGRSDTRHVSKNISVHALPSHKTLKYRSGGGKVPSTTDHGEETRGELKARLARAERNARNKRRRTEGLEPEEGSDLSDGKMGDDGEGFKRPKLPSAPTSVDEDDEDEDDADIESRARAILQEQGITDDDDQDDDEGSDEEDEDEEDETMQLMRELEKIRAERAAKKAEEEQKEQERREEEIARGNPLLNAEFKFGERAPSPSAASFVSAEPSFGVKRRWDDDVIFKNQATGAKKESDNFVNDLTRTDFHKQFLNRYIK